MSITATNLRADLYHVLDQILATGEPVEIIRKGRVLRIIVADDPPKRVNLDDLRPMPGFVVTGDPDDLVHMDWSEYWNDDLP